ncbi:MAG TPA: molybdopterin-dependent oxidoreductase [Pyrinomonadaceae bacterium]|nr:molybdopterin-dependent oxidoreductase [Pyrinomonadaceae bacterium]
MRFIQRACLIALMVAASCVAIVTSAQINGSLTQSSDVLLTVGGVVERLTLTRADLDKFARQSVTAKGRDGKEHKYEGVAVGEILQKVGVKFGEALHQDAVAKYLLAEAADGYQVVFALPEFDSPSIDRLILLADRQDGGPLPASTGPLQIIVPGDKGHGHWIRQVNSLSILRAPTRKTGL